MKKNRLVVGVLGRNDSGKSKTWYTLFGRRVTIQGNPKRLELRPDEWVRVFLINRSQEETGRTVEEILRGQNCPIVLCSMRYATGGKKALNYFIQEGFDLYVQWLNPGFDKPGFDERNPYPYVNKKDPSPDRLGLRDLVRAAGGQFFIRNGNTYPTDRVEEIREQIYKWAKVRNLVS